MVYALDELKRADYWKRFEDGSPQRWKSTREGDAWTFEFPNGAIQIVDRSQPNISWIGSFDKDTDSTRLWTNSLRYVLDTLEAGDIEVTIRILESFNSFLQDYENRPNALFSGSIDHQCALQLRTCCEVSSWLSRQSNALQSSVSESLSELLGELVARIRRLVDELDLLQPNNHGIMLGIAGLHSSFFFPDGGESARGKLNYVDFLYSSLRKILGEDGLCDENTVLYQAFYVRLLTEISEFLSWAEDKDVGKFDALTSASRTALSRLLLPNGDVPPIGDSSTSSQSKHRAEPGIWQSLENGIFVRSSKDSYVSFVCGYRGVFHKQMDDTSIILWHEGKFLIQDAGLASYDKKDPVAVSLRTQLGHSGLFIKKFDRVPAESVVSYGARTRLVKSVMNPFEETVDGNLRVTGNVNFRQTQVERSLTFVGERSMLIRDVVRTGSRLTPAVSRFVLDPRAEVSMSKDAAVIIRNGQSWVKISHPKGLNQTVIFRGDRSSEEGPRGFMAPRNYTSVPTYMIEIPLDLDGNGEGKIALRLDYGSGEVS